MATIEEMKARLVEINDKTIELTATAEAEGRELTDEEREERDKLLTEFDSTEGELETRKRVEQQTARLRDEEEDEEKELYRRRKTEPEKPTVRWRRDKELEDPTWGFRNMGEFTKAIVDHGQSRGQRLDERIQKRASLSTYGSEGVAADGGFAVPPDFRPTIMKKVMGEESLLALTNQLTSSTNSLTVPKDESTPWAASGGVQTYWTSEAGAITQSKPSLESTTIPLHKLAVLVPLTDELMMDAPALGTWVTGKAGDALGYETNHVIVQGTGAGQPLGILNAGGTVSVAKVTSQDADTVVAQNLIDMYSRLYAKWRGDAVWLINQNVEPMLLSMSLPGKDETGTAVSGYGALTYMPPGGLSASPYATLFGKRVIPTEACETLGDKGDIFFVALSQYATVTRNASGIRQDTSIHMWFDQDVMALRFIMRLGGQPWWNTAIAGRDLTTSTYSAFVTLDTR